MNDQTKFLGLFKTQLMLFCDDLANQFPNEPQISIFKFVIDQIPVKQLVQGFYEHSNRKLENGGLLRDMVMTKDANYFIEERPFGFISDSRNDMMVVYWKSMDDESKLAIWSWFDMFVKLADRACI